MKWEGAELIRAPRNDACGIENVSLMTHDSDLDLFDY